MIFDGNLIRMHRENAGLRPEALAAACGTSARSLARWELGHAVPSAESIARIASALDLPVGQFYRPLDDVAPASVTSAAGA